MHAVQPCLSGVEPLLLACTQVATFIGPTALTAASGFIFQRGAHLLLVTSRHVLLDRATDHRPQRIEFVLRAAGSDMAQQHRVSLPLQDNGTPLWRDTGGDVDVAALKIPAMAMPRHAQFCAFGIRHIQVQMHAARRGESLQLGGVPLGLHDTLHHLPVARSAVVASAFGVRFQRQGYFITEGPIHSGSSGAPVVRHDPDGDASLPWQLMGVHAPTPGMAARPKQPHASHGLHPAWYADALLVLTQ